MTYVLRDVRSDLWLDRNAALTDDLGRAIRFGRFEDASHFWAQSPMRFRSVDVVPLSGAAAWSCRGCPS